MPKLDGYIMLLRAAKAIRSFMGGIDAIRQQMTSTIKIYQSKFSNVYQINFEDAYYMRGAVKYRLNPKDTTAAEADRIIAIKLHGKNAILIRYKSYCSDWK